MLGLGMQKLTPVEDAKALFEEAKDWGLWKWLTEKSRARRSADAAWAALEECEKKVKASWSDGVRKAWRAGAQDVDPEMKAAVERLRKACREGDQARIAAEAQFDEADRRLSTSMAREGAQMAIDAWILREKLLRKMESLGRKG